MKKIIAIFTIGIMAIFLAGCASSPKKLTWASYTQKMEEFNDQKISLLEDYIRYYKTADVSPGLKEILLDKAKKIHTKLQESKKEYYQEKLKLIDKFDQDLDIYLREIKKAGIPPEG